MQRIFNIYPFTFGGTIILLLAVYLVSLREQFDLIAQVIGVVVLAYIALTLLLAITTLYLNKNITIKNLNDQEYISRNKCHLKFQISSYFLPFFFELTPYITYKLSKFTTTLNSCRSNKHLNLITADTTFPHRGNWEASYVYFEFTDLFNLVRFAIRRHEHFRIKVVPQPHSVIQRKLIYSTYVSGDLINQDDQHLGDYYDFKKYHPSDGARRIVWRMFAKNRELVSRHPERTMDPAGESVIFFCGNNKSDTLAQDMLNYLKQLQEQDLNYILKVFGNDQPARDFHTAKNALLDSGFIEKIQPQDTEASIRSFISTVKNNSEVNELAIFIPDDEELKVSIAQVLQNNNLKGTFFIKENSIREMNNFIEKLYKLFIKSKPVKQNRNFKLQTVKI